MRGKMRRAVAILLAIAVMAVQGSIPTYANEAGLLTAAADTSKGPEIGAPSALLMEASTGTVIYEKNADEPRNPASVTKIMTLILIFDALQSGKIKMNDEVVTSAHAKSMGGSQVFLEDCIIIGLNQIPLNQEGRLSPIFRYPLCPITY